MRSRTSSLPQGPTTYRLAGGIAPSTDDFQDALDRLEGAEEVDLVIASVAPGVRRRSGGVRTVHQAVVAHCTKMADVARNRIGLGSVTAIGDERPSTASSTTPTTSAATTSSSSRPPDWRRAVAGLLGLQDYFESPTFKTIASPDATAGQLHRRPARTADHRQRHGGQRAAAPRRHRRQGPAHQRRCRSTCSAPPTRPSATCKALAERYIGLLNNDGNRRALLQQVARPARPDGARRRPRAEHRRQGPGLYRRPCTRARTDVALGIVRIDIAVRPVRAIDYVYATILVKN